MNSKFIPHLLCAALVLWSPACNRKTANASSDNLSRAAVAPTPNPLRIVLAPLNGKSPLDEKISHAQEQVRAAKDPVPALERLGWLFVAKARASFDPGYYKLAEQCSLAIAAHHPASLEALLLRGHVLHSLHRFKEAEPIARELVARRGRPFDFGLLGDVLVDEGKLGEAATAYQQMIDLRPDLHSYSRAAQLRWLKGDLAGAIEVMRLAVSAASPLDAESAAWVHTRLAGYEFQSGDLAAADRNCGAALEFQNDYAPALLLRGRIRLEQNQSHEAIPLLRRAAELNPLPEYQWVLSDALRAAGQLVEAGSVEQRLKDHGAGADPRSFALYLATRGEDSATAIRLATEELNARGDVFTHDALAWSLTAEGRWLDAQAEMRRALSEGTQDARLFLHAGIIAAKLGNARDAEKLFQQAEAIRQTLLPSEKALLREHIAGVVSGVSPDVEPRPPARREERRIDPQSQRASRPAGGTPASTSGETPDATFSSRRSGDRRSTLSPEVRAQNKTDKNQNQKGS